MRGIMSDGVNDPRASRLKRAFQRRFGRFDAGGIRYVQAALKRIDKEVSTMDMEVRKLERHGYRLY